MALVLECLPRHLYSIFRVIGVNDNVIKAPILNIDATRQSLIYYNKVVLLRHHTSRNDNAVNALLFLTHRLVIIVNRMQLDWVKALLARHIQDTLIRLYERRVTPITLTRLWPQLLYMC